MRGASLGLKTHGCGALKFVCAGYFLNPTSNLRVSTVVPGLFLVKCSIYTIKKLLRMVSTYIARVSVPVKVYDGVCA